MRLTPLFRVLGALLYGIVGYYLGVSVAGTYQLTTASIPVVWSATIAGMLLGYFLAPWLIIAPARCRSATSCAPSPWKTLFAATLGLALGLLIAALLAYPLSRLPPPFGGILPLIGVFIFGYLGAAAMVLRKQDFYVLIRPTERQTDRQNERPPSLAVDRAHGPGMLLDTSVIIDGRIADVANTGFLLGTSGGAALRAQRTAVHRRLGRYAAPQPRPARAGDARPPAENPDVDIEFIDQDPSDATQVDDKLISLARQTGRHRSSPTTTTSTAWRACKASQILNINELANAVKSVFLPGEEMPIRIIQEGKESGQGVGYLEDGTMVVVENGRRFINQEVLVQVTKVLQTNAGRLIFAVPEGRRLDDGNSLRQTDHTNAYTDITDMDLCA